MNPPASRRAFLQNIGLGSLGVMAAGRVAISAAAPAADPRILGESGVKTSARPKGVWKPVSERKIRVGIVGYGVCKFGAAVRLPRSSERHRGGRQRPVSRPLPRTGQGMPMRENVSFAGRTGQRRHAGGRLRGDRRPQPRQALHRRPQPRQTRGVARCRPCSARSRTPTSCCKRSGKAGGST